MTRHARPPTPSAFPPPSDSRIRASAPVAPTPAVDPIAAFVGERPAKKRKPISKAQAANARADAKARSLSGDWAGARGLTLVALWEYMHELVYGVAPADLLAPADWLRAAATANRFLDDAFAGDANALVDFMRWTWRREEGREQWRRENGKSGGRIGYRLQFSGSILSDFRVDHARQSEA